MGKFLQQFHPLENTRSRFMTAAVVSLFIYGLLALMQPFDLNMLKSENKHLILLGYGLLVWLHLVLFYVLVPSTFRSVFDEDNWKVYKEFIWLLMIMIFIGASVAGYEDIIATRPLCFNCVYESIGKTVAIGVIPVFGLTILNRYRLLRKHLEEAKEMHDRLLLDRGKSQPQTVKLIQLSSSNKGENFEADLDDILFISALGNYVEVHHLKYGELTKTILRSTLSSLIEQLTEYHQIHQCHRAYLVNLNNVKDVVGNAGGYELSFGFEGPVVPVSKRKTAEFRRLMSGK